MKRTVPLCLLFTLVLAALWASTGVLASSSGPAYLDVRSFSVETQSSHLVKLSVTTGGSIPRQPDAFIRGNPVVGIAWADLGDGKVFVTSIHPAIGRDSHQDPDAWHAHTATLAPGATPANDLCVASIDSTPTAGIQIHGDTMDVNVRADELPAPASAFDATVGFTLQPDSACPSGLGVRVVN